MVMCLVSFSSLVPSIWHSIRCQSERWLEVKFAEVRHNLQKRERRGFRISSRAERQP
jgi:hypothetical protein